MNFALLCVTLLGVIAVSEALIPLLLFKSLIPIPLPLPLPLPVPIPIPKPVIFSKLLGGKALKIKISADVPHHHYTPEVHIGGYAHPQYKESKAGWAGPPPPPPPPHDQHYESSENAHRYQSKEESGRDVHRAGPQESWQPYASASDGREIKITANGVPLLGTGTVRVRFHG